MSSKPKKNLSVLQLLTSTEWINYFNKLSNLLNIQVSVYNEEGTRLFFTQRNPVCQYAQSEGHETLKCPESCNTVMLESLKTDEPLIYKCSSQLTNFAFSLERSGEKAVVSGCAGFAEYNDLLEFLKIVRENELPPIPVKAPFEFPGEAYIGAVSKYVLLTVSRTLNAYEEKQRLEEKLLRMTSLFDSRTFGILSRNPELMYRYMLDTIEFIFGRTSGALMLMDRNKSVYRTVSVTGKYKNAVLNFQLDARNPVVGEMINTASSVYAENLERVTGESPLKEIKPSYFFPLFIGGVMEMIIWIFDREFTREEMKIMNAFRDYIQLNLENQRLRTILNNVRSADEKLSSIEDFFGSIVAIMDKETLLKKLLEKSMQLIRAEKGSLMLIDEETSELVVEASRSLDDFVKEKMRLKKEEGIAGLVIESGDAFLVNNIEKDPRISKENRPRYKTKSFMSIPINIEGKVAGVLNISDKIEGSTFTEEDLGLIKSFIKNASIAIERSLLFHETEEFRKLSITDPLTGIYNRRYLNTRLSEEITRYNRYKTPFSFLMFDLDRFKEYNDTYGHISGDRLLKTLAAILQESLRTIDIAARFGGDEFVAIFPQTPKVDAIQITNRLKEKIDIAFAQIKMDVPVSVSMGLATYPDDASSIMELIEKTDQALYLAKKGGGNKIVYL